MDGEPKTATSTFSLFLSSELFDDDDDDDDDVGLHVLGCRVDILGTNCKKLLKVKMSGGGGGLLQLQYV